MIRLSLCLIARNEEQLLPGCLASVASAVDEMVVVDTGSSDATATIARAAGARVIETPWEDDFSGPRNLALSCATGDFVLVVDADERLTPGSGERLRAALELGQLDCGLVRLHNASHVDADPAAVVSGRSRLGTPILLPRVLRRAPELRYTGIVHESVSDWVSATGARLVPLEVDLVHLGALPDLRAQRHKVARNLQLLQRRCALEPQNITPLAYLALELIGQGDRAAAAEAVQRGWALLPQQPVDRSVLRLAVAMAIVSIEAGAPDPALEAIDLAERKEGPEPDLHHLRGRALLELARRSAPEDRLCLLSQAQVSFRAALSFAGRQGLRQYVAGASSWASWIGLGEVLLATDRPVEARQAFDRALVDSPDHPGARLGVAESLLDTGQPAQALSFLEPLLDQAPDGWLLAASAAKALGAVEDARFLLVQARKRLVPGFRAPHRAERLAAITAELGSPVR
jgi:cytochrome c-type biogenesis protein CcmH/NrfG